MRNSMWKLLALAGVVGVGLLVVVQAQLGLKNATETTAEQEADPFATDGAEFGDPAMLTADGEAPASGLGGENAVANLTADDTDDPFGTATAPAATTTPRRASRSRRGTLPPADEFAAADEFVASDDFAAAANDEPVLFTATEPAETAAAPAEGDEDLFMPAPAASAASQPALANSDADSGDEPFAMSADSASSESDDAILLTDSAAAPSLPVEIPTSSRSPRGRSRRGASAEPLEFEPQPVAPAEPTSAEPIGGEEEFQPAPFDLDAAPAEAAPPSPRGAGMRSPAPRGRGTSPRVPVEETDDQFGEENPFDTARSVRSEPPSPRSGGAGPNLFMNAGEPGAGSLDEEEAPPPEPNPLLDDASFADAGPRNAPAPRGRSSRGAGPRSPEPRTPSPRNTATELLESDLDDEVAFPDPGQRGAMTQGDPPAPAAEPAVEDDPLAAFEQARGAAPRRTRPRIDSDEELTPGGNLPTEIPAPNASDEFIERPAQPRFQADATVEPHEEDAAQFPGMNQTPSEPEPSDAFPAQSLEAEPADAAEFGSDRRGHRGTAPRTEPRTAGPAPASEPAADPLLDDESLIGTGLPGQPAQRGPQRPQLTIEKVAPPNAVLGQPLVYQILVRNVGATPARQVIVEDQIPQGSKLTGTIPRAELVDKTLIWRLGTLAAGEEKKIAVRVIPMNEGELGSIAKVNFVAEVAAQTRVTAPRLQLQVSAPRQVQQGEAFLLRFQVTNLGSGRATNVVLRDILPDELSHPGGNDLEYVVGTLAAGQSQEIELTVTAARTGTAQNHTIVTADGMEPEESLDKIEIVGSRVGLQREGPRRAFLGRPTSYTNRVTNSGTTPLSEITIVEQIPEGTQFVEASAGGQYDPSRGIVVWQLGTLPAGQSAEVQITLSTRSRGAQEGTVQVYDRSGPIAQKSVSLTGEGVPSLGVEVSEVSAPIAVGEQIDYHVRLANRGSDAAANASLAIEVPAQFRVVDVAGPLRFRQTGNRLEFEQLPELQAGRDVTLKLTLQAVAGGDARLKLEYAADYMQRPLLREEGLLVLDEQTASR